MADTIKAVIEELTNPLVHVQTGFYLPDHKVDQALAEIKRILETQVIGSSVKVDTTKKLIREQLRRSQRIKLLKALGE